MRFEDDADGPAPDPSEPDGRASGRPSPPGPLPPDDRLWRHPSELGAQNRPTPPPPAPPVPPGRPLTAPGGDGGGGRRMRPTWGLVAASAACGAVAAAAVLLSIGVARDPGREVREWLLPASDDREPAEIADDLLPSVVRLEATGPDGTEVGAGLVFRDDGHVLTTADLVEGTSEVTAVLRDGQSHATTVVGADTATDLAVVRIDGVSLAAAPLGSATALQPGEATLTIEPAPGDAGTPTVTRTVVGATTARLTPAEGAPPLHGMLQLNSASPVRSGGAVVVDQRGAVVGITTQRRPAAGVTATGLTGPGPVPASTTVATSGSWATPVDYARKVADDLIRTGRAQHVWLGVEHAETEVDGAGARVYDVVPASPADTAGLAPDDVLVTVAGRRVHSMDEVIVTLREHRPGDALEIEYRREGESRTCSATLAPPPGT